MTYIFNYRRRFFWHKIKVIGHHYEQVQDKMALHLPDGSIQEIASWKSCEVKLGADWVLAMKKQMEKASGQSINIDVGNGE